VPSIVEHLCPRGEIVSPLLVLVYFQVRFGNHHVVIRPVAEDIERLSQSLPACATQSSADHLDPAGIGGLHQCRPCHDNNSEQAKQSRDPRFCKGSIPSPPHDDVWVMYGVLRPPAPTFLHVMSPRTRWRNIRACATSTGTFKISRHGGAGVSHKLRSKSTFFFLQTKLFLFKKHPFHPHPQ
jgi:hypothetical protein